MPAPRTHRNGARPHGVETVGPGAGDHLCADGTAQRLSRGDVARAASLGVHLVVEEVTDPKKEVSLVEAKKKNPAAEVGTEILAAKPTDVLGRIAAQTAKQVILQKVREAERDTIFNEYHTRVGELVTVIVKRAEGPDLIVDMGRTEARLPKREQSKLETYNIGERLRVVIKMVDRAAKGPQVIVSRAANRICTVPS